MKMRNVFVAASVFTAVSLFAPAVESPVTAFGMPEYFASCGTALQENCVELLEYTPQGGETTEIADPTTMSNSDHIYVGAFVQDTSGCPQCFPMLSFNILSATNGSSGSGTNEGVPSGSYRLVLRVNTFDPTVLLSFGPVIDYTATKDEQNHWTIDVTMSTTVFGGPSNDQIVNCSGRTWGTECDNAGQATKNYVGGSLVTITMGVDPESMRGMYVATNAVGFSWPQIDVTNRTISATVVGPHRLPSDFGDCAEQGLETDGGRCVTPARYIAYLPFKAIGTMLNNMPEDVVKAYFSEDAMTAEAYGRKWGDFDVEVDSNGVKVDFNIGHYSRPNPKITLKAIKTLKAGQSASRSNFITVPSGATLTEFNIVKQKPIDLCSKVLSNVKAAAGKSGFCVLQWKYTKAGRTTTKKTVIRIVR